MREERGEHIVARAVGAGVPRLVHLAQAVGLLEQVRAALEALVAAPLSPPAGPLRGRRLPALAIAAFALALGIALAVLAFAFALEVALAVGFAFIRAVGRYVALLAAAVAVLVRVIDAHWDCSFAS